MQWVGGDTERRRCLTDLGGDGFRSYGVYARAFQLLPNPLTLLAKSVAHALLRKWR
jgi:hypothetical protein